jgi:hypothetical protein
MIVARILKPMKISELCKLIEDSIHSGIYPMDQEVEKSMGGLVQIRNNSSSDDLNDMEIKIEVRINELYVINNYVQSIQHLPGAIEMDALDSFKMLCRRVKRMQAPNTSFHQQAEKT